MGDARLHGRGGGRLTAAQPAGARGQGSALVVLSGGMDSTVCLALAAADHDAVSAVTFDYGQRHRRELDHAARVAGHYGAPHLVVTLDTSAWGGSALTDRDVPVPEAPSSSGAIPATYVPARNLIFLSVAMGIAEARDADAVYLGVNALDYSGYPDCRPEFVAAFRQAAALALKRGVEGRPVDVRAPLISLTKAEIVRLGLELDAPLHLTWSCYQEGERPCGRCDACRLRARGFDGAGVVDPVAGG